MKVVMKCYYSGPKGEPELAPGAVHEFDDAEAARLIEVGGARAQTDDEIAAELEAIAAADKLVADAAAAKAAAKSAK
jgi:hypothetical protein